MAEDRVIGRDGALPWHLSSDLRRFKQLTMGHHLLMGRRTFESIGRPLPGRTSVVITRQAGYQAPESVVVAPNFEAALAAAPGDDEPFVIGGAQIYQLALPRASRIYLTEVHAAVPGDVRFPPLDSAQWRELSRERFEASPRDEHPHTFRVLQRVGGEG